MQQLQLNTAGIGRSCRKILVSTKCSAYQHASEVRGGNSVTCCPRSTVRSAKSRILVVLDVRLVHWTASPKSTKMNHRWSGLRDKPYKSKCAEGYNPKGTNPTNVIVHKPTIPKVRCEVLNCVHWDKMTQTKYQDPNLRFYVVWSDKHAISEVVLSPSECCQPVPTRQEHKTIVQWLQWLSKKQEPKHGAKASRLWG